MHEHFFKCLKNVNCKEFTNIYTDSKLTQLTTKIAQADLDRSSHLIFLLGWEDDNDDDDDGTNNNEDNHNKDDHNKDNHNKGDHNKDDHTVVCSIKDFH